MKQEYKKWYALGDKLPLDWRILTLALVPPAIYFGWKFRIYQDYSSLPRWGVYILVTLFAGGMLIAPSLRVIQFIDTWKNRWEEREDDNKENVKL